MFVKRSHSIALGFTVLFICIARGGLAQQPGFSTIAVPGATSTSANGINDAGDIVGSYPDTTGQYGFVLSKGAFTKIDVPGAFSTDARGISSGGDVVGFYAKAPGLHGFSEQRRFHDI